MTPRELQVDNLQLIVDVASEMAGVKTVALYGSAARGDSEPYSDVDLLVVCSHTRKFPILQTLEDRLRTAFDRLSLTVYTEDEIGFLRSVRSLFLLHLKREAVVLVDKARFLEDALFDFEPKHSYESDFRQSLALTDPLRNVVLGAPNNCHRLSFIYSLFRVFGVYMLADKKIYEFSKPKMAQLLGIHFPLAQDSVDELARLRSLNSHFFSDGNAASRFMLENPTITVEKSAAAIQALTGVPFNVTHVSFGEAVQQFIEASPKLDRRLDYRLRMWFLLLIYDGLNLYLERSRRKTLLSFAEPSLESVCSSGNPPPIKSAAQEALEFIRRYPLKYFLNEDEKISTPRAHEILQGLRSLSQ